MDDRRRTPSDGKRSRCLWQGELKNEKKLVRSFNVTFRYIDPVFSLNNSRCSDFVDRIYPVSALRQNEVLCYLSYEVPYLGPEGAKSGRPTQAVGHTKLNAFKFKIAQQKQKSIEFCLLAGRWASPSQRGSVLKHNGKSPLHLSHWDNLKNTTNTDTSTLYLDLHLKIDSERRSRTELYDIRDDFNFPIVNFPFICSDIPAAPAYGVYISQLTLYSTDCASYQDFIDKELTRKRLNQRFLLAKLKSSLRKFHGRHHDLVDRYRKSVVKMTTDMFHLLSTLPLSTEVKMPWVGDSIYHG